MPVSTYISPHKHLQALQRAVRNSQCGNYELTDCIEEVCFYFAL